MTAGSNFFVSNIESFQISAIENGTAHAWLPASGSLLGKLCFHHKLPSVNTQDSPLKNRASQPIASGSWLDFVEAQTSL